MILGGRQGGGRPDPGPATRHGQDADLLTLFTLAGSRQALVEALVRRGQAEQATAPTAATTATTATAPTPVAAATTAA